MKNNKLKSVIFEKLDIWLFYGFLITSVLSIRKVLIYFPINSNFNEWGGIYLYLSDIFLLLTLISWLKNILHNKLLYLSRFKNNNLYLNALLPLPLFLVLWSFITAIWSTNQLVALYRAIKLLAMFFLYVYVIMRIVPLFHVEQFSISSESFIFDRFTPAYKLRFLDKINSLIVPTGLQIIKIIIYSGFIQAIIAIIQFISQQSLGFFWLFESQIAPDIDGVAKIVFNGEKFIRSYGLFPHPNILGGFLVISIIFTLLLIYTLKNAATGQLIKKNVAFENVSSEQNDLDLKNVTLLIPLLD